MNELQEIDKEITVTMESMKMLIQMQVQQRKILVNLYRERCLEKQRIKKIIDLCMTGK